MWLLDANMPLQLVALLRNLGVEAILPWLVVGARSAMVAWWKLPFRPILPRC
jgi:hypothetical protein